MKNEPSPNGGRSFGVLTLATPNDYRKAIGLALSVRVSNPGVPIAVACSQKVRPLVAPYFDQVIEEKAGLRGFVHKVYLDQYSPFDETMFFDSDVLVFKSLEPYIKAWAEGPYHACGIYMSEGQSTFGLDRPRVLRLIGKERLTVIDGAGHAFFRRPGSADVFSLARQITAEHRHYAGDIPYADEDVIDIAMTMLDLPPTPHGDFFARYMSAVPGTMQMDAAAGVCRFIYVDTGQPMEPCMVHFAANEAPIHYAMQLWKLFRKFGVPTDGLVSQGLADFYELKIKPPLANYRKRVKRLTA